MDAKKYFTFVIFPIVIIILVMLFYSVDYLERNVTSTKLELYGLEKVSDIEMIVIDLQQFRGIANIAKPGTVLQHKMESLKERLEEKIRRFREKNSDHDLQESPYRETESLFHDIEYLSETHTFTPEQRFLIFSGIIESFLYSIKKIATHTGLTFDDDAVSFFLIDNITVQIPKFIEYSGKLRGISLGLSGTKEKQHDVQNLLSQLDKMQERLGVLKYNTKTIIDHLENSQELQKSLNTVLQAHTNFVGFIQTCIINAREPVAHNEKIFNVSTHYINQLVALYMLNRKLLMENLEAKITQERFNQYFLFGGAITLLSLILYSHMRYYRINKKQMEIIHESNKQLELMSITDSLTGLFNRRCFDKVFSRVLKQIRRDHSNMILIMADIDCFKEYNDTYGHQKGDEALINVAKTFEAALHRPGDYVFRLGGEEFGVIMSDMTQEAAVAFAKSLCRSIEEKKIEHSNNRCGSAYLTVSMGFMYVSADESCTESSIYKEVDDALYMAKAFGRNRVVVCSNSRDLDEKL